MAEPKEQTDAEKHEAYEKERAASGQEIHLPRAGEVKESVPTDGKKKTSK